MLNRLQTHLFKARTPSKTEFGNASLKFLIKRFDWRFVSQEKRTKDVNDFINSLSKEAFDDNIDMIFLQVNTTKKECQKYQTSKDQVKAIVKRLPRFGSHESKLLDYVRKQRTKYHLGSDNG